MMVRYLFYRFYRLGHGLKRLIFRRFTRAGHLVLTGLALASLYGLDTRLTMSFQIWTFLAALVTVALAWGLFFRGKFSAERELPRFATRGDLFHYRILVRNLTSRRQRGLVLFEEFEDTRPSAFEFVKSDSFRIHKRDPLGWYRWRRFVTAERRARSEEFSVSELPPNSLVEVKARLLPERRGRLNFTGITVAAADPFGIFRSLAKTPCPQAITVLPRRYPLPPIHLAGIRKLHPGGVALTSSVGDSEEFVSLRDYVPGDPMRRIHWKSWAKAGKPIVKEHQEEYFVHHALLLDTFQDEADDIFEEAVSVAASFASTVRTRESLLDLMFVGPKAYVFTAGRGLAHTDRMLEILASVAPCRDKPVDSLIPLIIKRSGLLSACICVLISWDDKRQKLVQTLRRLGLPAKVLVLTDTRAEDLNPGPMKDALFNFHQLRLERIERDLASVK